MGDEMRSVHSFVRQRTFLVSLALALGLLAVNRYGWNHCSSTRLWRLDAETLRVAMDYGRPAKRWGAGRCDDLTMRK
jgi:hypothetical protein